MNRKKNEIEQCKTLQDLFHFTNEELSNFYTTGVQLYNQSHYEDASNIFLLLTQLNPLISSSWSSLALAEEKRGELQDAVHAYLIAAGLEENTLTLYMDAIRCLLLLKKTEEAKRIIEIASHRAETEELLKKSKNELNEFIQQIKKFLV